MLNAGRSVELAEILQVVLEAAKTPDALAKQMSRGR
jgi:hypothetical protein